MKKLILILLTLTILASCIGNLEIDDEDRTTNNGGK